MIITYHTAPYKNVLNLLYNLSAKIFYYNYSTI
jgi:hypothetical protein